MAVLSGTVFQLEVAGFPRWATQWKFVPLKPLNLKVLLLSSPTPEDPHTLERIWGLGLGWLIPTILILKQKQGNLEF